MSAPAGRGILETAWLFKLRLAVRRLWLRAALFAVLGVATAILAAVLAPYVPDGIAIKIGGSAVDTILSLMATSMLAVTTFSLSTMVAAQTAAAQSGSPRATELLTEHNSAHTALSIFIGAFLFSVVGLIALATESYGAHGRVIMFGMTIIVLAAVVATLIRWIDSLARLGRVRNTIEHVEAAAGNALRARAADPYRSGAVYRRPPRNAKILCAPAVGYIQHIDGAALGRVTENRGVSLFVEAEPGSLVHPGRVLARFTGELNEIDKSRIVSSFVIGGSRTFDQDMRYGLIVLCEVGQRALSPAINDPGTAMDVIGVQLRLLTDWQKCRAAAKPAARYRRLYVREPSAEELIQDALAPIARDAGGNPEVHSRLQKAFAALVATGDAAMARAARRHAKIARERATSAFGHSADRRHLDRARLAKGL